MPEGALTSFKLTVSDAYR